jgi:transketolase
MPVAAGYKLPVRLIGNGGGMVYAPLGATHTAIEDIALMRALPDMAVVAPADAEEMKRFMAVTLDWPGPLYIRLAKGNDPLVHNPDGVFQIGKGRMVGRPQPVLLVATGVTVHPALAAAEILRAESIPAAVLSLQTAKPLDTALLAEASRDARLVVTVEEHVRDGGLGTAVLEFLADLNQPLPRVIRMGLPNAFRHKYGSQAQHLKAESLTPEGIAARVRTSFRGG